MHEQEGAAMQQAIERISRVLASDQIAYDELQGLLADATALPPGELDTLIARADAVHRLLIGARMPSV